MEFVFHYGNHFFHYSNKSVIKSEATKRWEKESLKYATKEVIKEIAVATLMGFGAVLALFSGLVPMLIGSLTPHQIETPFWLILSFFGLSLSGSAGIALGVYLFSKVSNWTNYAKKSIAKEVVEEFYNLTLEKEFSLEKIYDQFYSRIPLLTKCGFFEEEKGKELIQYLDDWKKVKDAKETDTEDKKKKQELLNSWKETFIGKVVHDLPFRQDKEVTTP